MLYVEDSPTTAHHTCRLMERHGLQVIHCSTAERAIELLAVAAPGAPEEDVGFDVVVTDFYLKDYLTGGDLLHAIRAKFRYSQQEMPVLVLTDAQEAERQVDVFHAGANDFVQKPIVEEILIARIRSLLLIKQQFLALKKQNQEMRRMATTDGLTGVRNKRYLIEQGDRFLRDRRNLPVSVMLIDIDHFKRLNDTHGHMEGDRVLAAMGGILRDAVREDTLVCRFGGEEFAVLLPRCGLDDACARAEHLRARVERLEPGGHAVTISIGVASTERAPRLDLGGLLAQADKALYYAKNHGRNLVSA